MKIKILLFVLFFVKIAFAHDQQIHQHIVRQAYQLLLKSYPQLVTSEFNDFVGSEETNTNSIAFSWGNGTIASGSWIEDEYDIVYHYGIGEIPNFNQSITPELAQLFMVISLIYLSVKVIEPKKSKQKTGNDLIDTLSILKICVLKSASTIVPFFNVSFKRFSLVSFS